MPLTATSRYPSETVGFNDGKTDSVNLRELPKNVSLGLTRGQGTLVNEMSTQQHVFDDIHVFVGFFSGSKASLAACATFRLTFSTKCKYLLTNNYLKILACLLGSAELLDDIVRC